MSRHNPSWRECAQFLNPRPSSDPTPSPSKAFHADERRRRIKSLEVDLATSQERLRRLASIHLNECAAAMVHGLPEPAKPTGLTICESYTESLEDELRALRAKD